MQRVILLNQDIRRQSFPNLETTDAGYPTVFGEQSPEYR